VYEASRFTPAPRHASHARTGWLPEPLRKQQDSTLPIDDHDLIAIQVTLYSKASHRNAGFAVLADDVPTYLFPVIDGPP
jgi:hypothetical protein